MLIDLHETLRRTLKQAAARIDGLAMYLAVCAFGIGAVVFALAGGEMSGAHSSRLVWGSILMIPITLIVYVRLTMFSGATPRSRAINAALLLSLPAFVYWVAV